MVRTQIKINTWKATWGRGRGGNGTPGLSTKKATTGPNRRHIKTSKQFATENMKASKNANRREGECRRKATPP